MLPTTNSYGSGTLVTGGTLVVSERRRSWVLQPAAWDFSGGGTLPRDGNGYTGTLRAVTWERAAGCMEIAAAANNFTLSGAVSGAGGLTKAGPGTLTLTGVNSHSGGTSPQCWDAGGHQRRCRLGAPAGRPDVSAGPR